MLSKSELLRINGPDPYEDTVEADEAVGLVFDVSVEALKQLDHENIFGTGIERSNLVLGIWMGDQSDEDRIEFARYLNPRSVVRRFAKEIEHGNDAFTELSRVQ